LGGRKKLFRDEQKLPGQRGAHFCGEKRKSPLSAMADDG